MSDPDYVLELRTSSARSAPSPPATEKSPRPWIGIHFECCGVYTRVYRNPDATAYDGFCPKCQRKVRLAIGPGGTTARFFTAR